MLHRVRLWRHIVMGLAIVAVAALGAVGVVGAGNANILRAEHFDAKQVVVSPAGAEFPDGVRVREVVDIDFGLTPRRGYQRIIPNDFGAPTDVTASSPDANGELEVIPFASDTRIRIGNPSVTFTGQRRYVLEYVLPSAQLSTGALALDIIGHDETFTTDRFDVVVTGFDLTATRCDVGEFGAFGGCDVTLAADGSYRTTIEPLEPGDGITIGGPIAALVPPAAVEVPDLPTRNPTGLRPIGLAMFAIGVVVATAAFFRLRHTGSNVVFGGGGAADAASGSLPVPAQGDAHVVVPTSRVSDARLAELATIEFVPPAGLEPWHGSALLRERVDDDTVTSWFSGMIAHDAIRIEGEKKDLTLHPGPGVARLNSVDRGLIIALFGTDDSVTLGKKYDPAFAAVWQKISAAQKRVIGESGWWDPPIESAPIPRRGSGVTMTVASRSVVGGFAVVGLLGVVAAGALAVGVLTSDDSIGRVATRLLGGSLAAILLTFLVVTVVAAGVYGRMLPSRTATGSAVTLRTESFRRFLEASEGRHVEWAWDNGLIREYSAWAVALGAAEAWSDAIRSSHIPDPGIALSGPLMVHSAASTFSSAHTAPSSSGGGGGGGGSGGGGGGGSSGSW